MLKRKYTRVKAVGGLIPSYGVLLASAEIAPALRKRIPGFLIEKRCHSWYDNENIPAAKEKHKYEH